MENFEGKLAVITGGGSGIGRELARKLAREGCHLALCDLSQDGLDETQKICWDAAGDAGVTVTISTHICDVSDEPSVLTFRDAALKAHDRDSVNLLFNNAGIGGGGSFIQDERADWERTFAVCWFGVYYIARAFMPALIAADQARLINTSSVNGFWASLGPGVSQTAYSAAKFAVKGFTEALITDLRLHAPHVEVSVVMPGHIGTGIALNTGKVLGKPDPLAMPADEVAKFREQMMKRGLPVDNLPDDAIRHAIKQHLEGFRDKAPTSAAEAATIILDGVRQQRWRILVGADAEAIDAQVRSTPEDAYEPEFFESLHSEGHFVALSQSRLR